MTTLFTPEELGRGLVSAARLEEPPKGSIVAALWALDIGCGHSLYFFFSLSNHLD